MSAEVIVRPCLFLDVQIGAEPAGRIVVELFSDKTPKTCENFRVLCASSFTPASASKPLTYKLSPFHRIINEFMIQGGDITAGDGTGGQSIYGGEFEDENIGWRSIDIAGLVCMANRGKGTNTSQFFITLAPCVHLNAKHTVFGHVVSGKDVLDRLSKVRVNKEDRPYEAVLISHCGELGRQRKAPPTSGKPQATLVMERPSGSNDRGRKRAKRSHSHSRSSSASSTRNDRKHRRPSRSPSPQRKRQDRRRSDIVIDETRRGRTFTRSPSSSVPASKLHRSPSPRQHRRKRSPSRSSSHAKSRSPHLRRRHTRSRSRSRLDKTRHSRSYRPDEEWIRREEAEREGGDSRFDGVIEDDSHDRGGGGPNHVYYGQSREPRGFQHREGRLGDGGEAADDGPEVKFKGRGSMKYREKRW